MKSYNKSLIGLAVLSVALVGMAQQVQHAPREGASPLIQGADLTDRQREHAKLFAYKCAGMNPDNQPITAARRAELDKRGCTDLLGSVVQGGDVIIDRGPGLTFYPTTGRRVDPAISLAEKADLVIVGHIQDKHSLLDEWASNVFTEYRTRVDEFIKGAPGSTGPEIVVLQEGGQIQVGPHIISIETEGSPQFAPNKQYLLFLKKTTVQGSFQETGAYEISGDRAQPIGVPLANSEQRLSELLFKLRAGGGQK